ncbi:MAG: hypothetical protein U9M97_04880 [Candidatus Hadarchaeota archaeon]|nr:hypothetical protein [Candidatus Hadarchaeota archaeon]
MAREVGVSRTAVRRWLRSVNSHPSNTILQKIINLALELDKTTAMGVLENDLLSHWEAFERFASHG